MKTALVISYVLVGILAFFSFMNYKELKKLQALIPKGAQEDGAPTDKNALAGDWVNQLQNKLQELNVDLKFNSNKNA